MGLRFRQGSGQVAACRPDSTSRLSPLQPDPSCSTDAPEQAAEGYVFMEHFGRTYPTIFMHKCQHCKGAGTVTCPHCNGYKVKRANPHTFRLSEQTTVGK